MKYLTKTIFIVLALITLSGCLPEGEVQTVNDTSTGDITDTDSETDSDEISDDAFFGTEITWMNSILTSNTLTINADNTKTIYLVGDQLHNFLLNQDNFAATYCIEATFNQSTSQKPKTIRVKAVPAFSNNFQAGTVTRFMRVNLNSKYGNDFCNVKTKVFKNGVFQYFESGDSNLNGATGDVNDVSIVNHPSEVCPTCINFLTSNNVTIFKYTSTVDINNDTDIDDDDIHLVTTEISELDYQNLSLRIDMNGASDNGQSSCSDVSCASEGFDCCIEGQCVNEKSTKSAGLANDPIGFGAAEQEKYTDANWYKKYPQFYYICLESPPIDETDTNTDPEDPEGEADDRYNELLSDYNCTEELKANSISDPYHRNPKNDSGSYTLCEMDDEDAENFYKTVMERLYQNCGCAEKNDLDEMVRTCPSYEYRPIFKTDDSGTETDEILTLNCYAPPAEQTPLPFQDMEVNINSKSAPHRFFDTANIEIDPFQSLPDGATGLQEGTDFAYLDDFKIFPNNGSFNMNSILGQMTTELNFAYPAKVIDLDFDKQYLIATRTGLYQGCPSCGKDSWFPNFSSFPTANFGVGLQAIGYTTNRDTYSTNLSLGNYGDTKFGRACFLPPTMIPFGHSENSNVQTQRENRLKAQAALFMNGYQRDWFGFNRGALIGSFDGVTWFAVGKGRIVKSTSSKLFLAINAPFADLANPTNHLVSVQEYDFSSSGAVYDFDPSLEINASAQNEAGSCQKFHQCEADSDCITKLGWEYSCGDVTGTKTKWPNFEPIGSSEVANESTTKTIVEILQQGTLPPGSSNKRCIYRGAGAPCRVDFASITDEGTRKSLTCAPNFYCASLSNTAAFNDEVARFGKPLDELIVSNNHFFGMDADVLGRPKHYMNTGSNLTQLPESVQTAIEESVLTFDSSAAGKVGLCRPGKLLPDYQTGTTTKDWEPDVQHQSADPKFRTDYISQIGGCNPTLFTQLRYSSCPMLDIDGNYVHTQDDFLNSNFTIDGVSGTLSKAEVAERLGFAQNSCGLESLSNDAAPLLSTTVVFDELHPFSAFKTIEGESLSTDNVQIEPTLAGEACLRKAGAVCHSDLDCSPNKLMADNADLAPLSFFGNLAEKSYYEEYLVCSQGEAEPSINDEAKYFEYNLGNNRCCREVGKSLTMYTEDSPNATESTGLSTHIFGGLNPTEPTRYSRYSTVDSSINLVTGASNLTRPSANADNGGDKTLDNSPNITDILQWKTVHDTAAKTCCGSNWVREFEDGTNDWSRNRLNIDPNDLKCLNYRSGIYLSENAEAYNLTQAQLDFDKPFMCRAGSLEEGGCIQQGITAIEDFFVERPRLNRTFLGFTLFNSDSSIMDDLWTTNLYSYDILIPYTGENSVATDTFVLDWSNEDNDIEKKNLITRLPSYMTFDPDLTGTTADGDIFTFLRVELPSLTSPGAVIECVNNSAANTNFDCTAAGHGGICGPLDSWTSGVCDGAANNKCCYSYDKDTRSIRVGYSNDSRVAANFEKDDLGLQIKWVPVGTLAWEIIKNPGGLSVDNASILDHRRSAAPGNAMYYLKKLAKFEYLGVPQMAYEPLYCNDIYQKMVPGIFKESEGGEALKTVMDFINHSKTFINPNVDPPFAFDTAGAPFAANDLNINLTATQELVDHNQIFSDNQFKCCRELGATIGKNDSNSLCCSGLAIDDDSEEGNKICKLPARTDLNVYLNKFISGEGLESNDEIQGLEVSDFDTVTGEPLTSTEVLQKIQAIGNEYCSSGSTVRGGAFGVFKASPQHPFRNGNGGLNSIVDEVGDQGTSGNNEEAGYAKFTSGVRWNHHIYCADE